ncbi:putative lipase 1 [[Candida] railenensis]|uniref:Lipase 1 n=1 Tax=[Candida] railenensis TaxID=45579 RepID=A0A9P0QSD6_9ASCO|nr:putative lipase 1 [[Candida] railenensis]
MNLVYLILSTIFVSVGLAAPLINPRAGVTLPSEDPFYSPPSGYENEELGAILRVRQLNDSIGVIEFELNVQATYQILVHSQDSHNRSNAIVATVFVPYNADPNKLVSYQMAEDTASPDCAPSYAMQLDSDILSWITPQVELLLVVPLLQEGYYVVVPDHEGPKATYVAGYQAGHAVLNSLRGAINLGTEIGINQNPEIALWGYSGGALATAWTAALQPTYAPELNVIGTAMGGVPVDLASTAKHCMGNLFSGFMYAAILGLSHEYPELAEELPSLVVSDRFEYLKKAEENCLVETLAYFAYSQWGQYSVDGVGILDNPVVKDVINQNNLLKSGLLPDCPILIYSSESDEIIPIEDTDSLFELYCSNGVNVEYRKDVFSGHIITAIDGVGLAFNFIRDRFNKVELYPTCQNSTVALDAFNEGGLVGLGDILVDDVEWLFGGKIGPSSPYSNTTSSSSGSPAGSSGLIATIVNFASKFISNAITPDNAENLTDQEIYDILGGYITTAIGVVTSATDFVSSIFGFGSSDTSSSTTSSNSTGTSSGGSLLSTLLSTGESLISGLSGNSTTEGSASSSSGGGILSSLLSSGTSILSNLLSSK